MALLSGLEVPGNLQNPEPAAIKFYAIVCAYAAFFYVFTIIPAKKNMENQDDQSGTSGKDVIALYG